MMEEARFRALADAYGGDLARWPAAEREAARAFQAAHPQRAEAALGDAARLDQLLTAAGPAQPGSGLEAAVLAAAPIRLKAEAGAAGAGPAPRWAGLAAAVALMVGAGAGWLAAPGADPYADPAFAEAFGALEDTGTLDDFTGEGAR